MMIRHDPAAPRRFSHGHGGPSAYFLQDSQVLEKNLESQQDQDHAAGKLCL